jgi:GntR family transcriptional repressor for pyruvate dehydrogenase complex
MPHFPQYELIAERILELIRDKGFEPGDKQPPERALAERFRVSRNCIREALRSLTESGIIRSRRGDGTYFEGPDIAKASEHIGKAVNRHKQRISEIFELRHMLEPQIAGLAAKRIGAEDLQKLKAMVCDQHRAVLAGEDESGIDDQFHRILAEAVGNRAVLEVLDAVHELLCDTRSAPLRDRERGLASVQGHHSIIEALEHGDSEGARKAMENHLSRIEQTVMK